MRAASGAASTENVGLAFAELEGAIFVCASTVVVGSVPIIECVVPVVVPTAVVEVALVAFVSLVTIPPSTRLAVPEVIAVAAVVMAFWADKKPSPSSNPTKSRGVELSTRGCEYAARRILIKTSVCIHIDA